MGGIDLTQSVVRQIPVPFREAWNSMVTLHGVDYTALDAVRALEGYYTGMSRTCVVCGMVFRK